MSLHGGGLDGDSLGDSPPDSALLLGRRLSYPDQSTEQLGDIGYFTGDVLLLFPVSVEVKESLFVALLDVLPAVTSTRPRVGVLGRSEDEVLRESLRIDLTCLGEMREKFRECAKGDEIVDALESVTPKSMGVDKADTTALIEGVTAESADGTYRISVDPADEVALTGDLDPDRDPIEYTHTELGDIADDATAYSLIPGRFYINLEGREPRGSVPEDEYEQVRAELKEELEALEGPDGRKVADRVVTKQEAFRGDHSDLAPDLVIVPNHGFDLKSGFKGRKNPFVEYGARNGMHSFDNATLLIDDDVRVRDADLYDIAPTILDLMDIDYKRGDFDGSSLV